MVATTTNFDIPFLELSDPPDIATSEENLANAVDAALETISGDVDAIDVSRTALLATLLGTGVGVKYVGPATNPASITSTAYVYVRDSSSNILAGTTFVAPKSGIVTVSFGMGLDAPSGGTATASVAVLLGGTIGSGTSFLAAADQNAIASNSGSITVPGSREVAVTGLTAGTTYNAGVLWKTSTGTAAGAHVWINVHPELN